MNQRKKPQSAMWGRSTLIACVLFACAGMAFAGPSKSKLASDLQNLKPSDKVDLIVQFKAIPTSATHKKVLKFGGSIRHQYKKLNFGAYKDVGALALAALNADSTVVHVSRDRQVNATTTAPDAAVLDYHNETMKTAAAWAQGLDGTGIGVAVIDSGVSAVDDLTGSRIVYSQDFVAVGGDGGDRFGHGTHVAGIIGGTGADSTGPNYKYTFKGIAQNANIINFRVLGPDGSGNDSDVIAAVDAAIQLKDQYNIRVINMSLGRGIYESYLDDPMCQAVERAWSAGIFVVVSAGNNGRNNAAGTNGYGTITVPGNDPYVITVGSLNGMGTPDPTDDIPGSYSSKGPSILDRVVKPDIVAPGNQIVSLYTPLETLNAQFPEKEAARYLYVADGDGSGSTSYFILSGTSMAAPMVSGAAALLLQQNPDLTPDQLKTRLMKTAFKNLQQASSVTDSTTGQIYNMQADIFTVGAGLLDIEAAVNDTAPASPLIGSAASPTVTIDGNGNLVLVFQPDFAVWGSNAAESEMVLWGSSVLGGTNSAGEMVLWGSSSLGSEMVMWGSSSTASEMVMWGSSSTAGLSVIGGDSK
jgi:serine protease AprX